MKSIIEVIWLIGLFSYLDDVLSSVASSSWLSMAGNPPKGAENTFPFGVSELLEIIIPGTPKDPWLGDEKRVGRSGCSLLCIIGVDPAFEVELFCPGLGNLKLVKTACGEKLSLWFPPAPPEFDPENYQKTRKISFSHTDMRSDNNE